MAFIFYTIEHCIFIIFKVWEKLEHQLSYIVDEHLSSAAIDITYVQSTNQVEVQQPEGWDEGPFPLQAKNPVEESQSILKEQCPGYYNNSHFSQKPVILDVQKTEISRNMQNVNNHCTTNYNNLAESETQCEFAWFNIPNCNSIQKNTESMNIMDLSHSPDVIPDSQNISSITQPAILKKVTKGSQKHNLKSLSNKIAKLKISKKITKIKVGSKPQCFPVTDNNKPILNNNDRLKKFTENGSSSVNPMSQGSCANTLQGPPYFIQNNVPAMKHINACKKKVQFSAPLASNSMGINSLLISSQTENQTQEPRPVNQTQEVGSENQTQEYVSVNQSQKFGSESQTQELGSLNETIEIYSENQTQDYGSVNQTQEFGSENQTQETGSVNQTIEFDSENQIQELGSVNQTQEFGSENQTHELDSVIQTQEIDSVNRPQKESSTINSTPSTSKVLPASVNSSLGWIKSMRRVYKVDPTELTALSMLPKSFLDDPLANLPIEWEGDFDIW